MTRYVKRTPSHRPTVKCRSLTNEFHEELEQEALGREAPVVLTIAVQYGN